MAYAIDILETTFKRTKKLFFPIRPKYWLRMGFVSLFSGRGGGGGSGGGNSGSRVPGSSNLNFRDALSRFNTEALAFLSQYGFFVGLGFILLYAISLIFMYINSVFTFVFLEGVVKKDLKIINSFSKNNPSGVNLFFLRFIAGIIYFVISLLIFSPLVVAFFQNRLAYFNFWLLIPMAITFFVVAILFGLFWFLVYDFVVPIMYLKKKPFGQAWKQFKKIALKNKLQIFLYWLFKILLGIASGILSLILLIPILLIVLVFVGIGVLIFLALNSIGGSALAMVVSLVLGAIFFLLFIYALAVIYVPIPAFFRIYSLEMLEKLKAI